jgi:RimJ/RimL family protein N-acetyltransferase
MRIPPQEITLPGGRACAIRTPEPEEAGKLLAWMRAIYEETPWLTRYPEESPTDERAEQRFLERMNKAPRGFFLGAYLNGQLAATTELAAVGDHIKTRHRATIGLAVSRSCWHLGIGRLLLETDLAQARSFGYRQIELSVYAENTRAVDLYLRAGFEIWGRTPAAYRFRDGSCHEELQMGLILDHDGSMQE